jgi:CDP-diacylglycerol---serine O-phosphatidyltransferase
MSKMPKVKEVLEMKKPMQAQLRQACPNMVTFLALAFGVSSLNFSFWGRWELAVLSLILAAVFDGLDGRVARMLNTSSKFGAELDSLSDFVSFGVAPAFLLYQWTMDQAARASIISSNSMQLTSVISDNSLQIADAVGARWVFVLLLSMCCALRLARFNTMLEEEPMPSYWTHFFVGLPAPGGAIVALTPLTLWLQFHWPFLRNPVFVSCFMTLSAFLMASRIPTLSLKHLHVSEGIRVYLSFFMLIVVALTLVYPWIVLGIISVGYLFTLPVGILFFLKFKKQALKTGKPSN